MDSFNLSKSSKLKFVVQNLGRFAARGFGVVGNTVRVNGLLCVGEESCPISELREENKLRGGLGRSRRDSKRDSAER